MDRINLTLESPNRHTILVKVLILLVFCLINYLKLLEVKTSICNDEYIKWIQITIDLDPGHLPSVDRDTENLQYERHKNFQS